MFLEKDDLQHMNSITHEGKVIVAAVNGSGTIFYTIRQDGFEDNYGKTALDGWEDWNELSLRDMEVNSSVIDKETQELSWGPESDPREKQLIIRSVFQGRGQSAPTPIQLVSAMGYLYVFRQSPYNTLFIDRFVLDGLNNKLIPKLDVRFKGSHQKYKPLAASQANGNLQANSLDFRDANGNYFYEPTLELSQLGSLQEGWFAVVLLPTAEHDHYRWHFFLFNNIDQQIEIVSIRASEDGLFDVRDDLQLLSGAGPQNIDTWQQTPGILRRTIFLDNLSVTGGPAATKYDLQVERNTQAGPQLLRESTRVMLAIPTDQGVATLSFAAAIDGTLSMIEESPDNTHLLVNRSKDVLLPINTLDEIQTLGSATPIPQGAITGIARGDANRLSILTDNPLTIKPGDPVVIGGTASYDGHYRVITTNNGAFEIQAAFNGREIGHWQAVPGDQNVIFDGMITAYEVTQDGKLRIHAPNHGLQAGDEVQIKDTRDYNGVYPVLSILGKSFTLDIPWQPGKGVNLKIKSRKRRGIAMDGQADYLETNGLNLTQLSKLKSGGETLSAWVYANNPASGQEQLIAGRKDGLMEVMITPKGKAALRVQFAGGPVILEDPQPVPLREWTHYAASFAYDPQKLDTTLRLCRNGSVVNEGLANTLRTGKAASFSLSLDGKDDYVDLLNPQVLNIAGRITLEAWVKPTTYDGEQIILAHGAPDKTGSNPNTEGPFLRIKEKTYEVGIDDGTGKVASAALEEADIGQWIHLAGVYDGASWHLYKNGREVSDLKSTSGANKTTRAWAIGAWGQGQGGFFHGLVDEVRVWRTARSAEDIQNKAGSRLLGDEPGLAGYWTFTMLDRQLDKDGKLPSQDAQVDDSSRQNNPGMIYGSPSLDSGPALTVAHLPETSMTWMPGFWIGGALVADDSQSGMSTVQRGFTGRLADCQVWDIERTPRDIENSMYLQLLGRETGLAGYWRLEAIAEGNVRTTTDFSVLGHDATVHGNAYVGARSLSRKLGDNTTLAVQYITEAYFSVTQRATYLETFEFKVSPGIDPNQADRDGKPLFVFSYWGKTSQNATDLLPFDGQTNQFEPAAESGWYQAVSTFTVPDGVNLVRTFGIGEVHGNWEQLDIRRHHIRMTSGSITETHYTEHLTLDTLGMPQAALEANLRAIAQKEMEEPGLIAEKLRLDDLIALADDPNLEAQINSLQGDLDNKAPVLQKLLGGYQYALNNPLNYALHLETQFTGPGKILVDNLNGSVQLVDRTIAEQRGPVTWYFDPRPDGYYNIRKSGVPGWSLGVNPASLLVVFAPDTNLDTQAWLPILVNSQYYRLANKHWGNSKPLDVNPTNFQALLADYGNYSGQYWLLSKWGAPINNLILFAQNAYNEYHDLVSSVQKRFTMLQKIQLDRQSKKPQWIQRRAEVVAALNDLQNQIAALRDSYLKAFAAPKPLSLPDLQTDSRSLTTSGGLLGFVHPASGITLIESSEGNLLLSYFDMTGRMRQTIYDATSDSSRNDTYQVWVPDALRVSLNFEVNNGRMVLNHPVQLGEEWTLEAWFAYPLANKGILSNQADPSWAPLKANTLVSSAGGDRHVTVQNGMLGSMQGNEFWPSGFMVRQLTHGWHHLAVVGKGMDKTSTTCFYIDGSFVGDTKATQLKSRQDQITDLQNELIKLQVDPFSNGIKIKDLQKQIDDLRKEQDTIANQPFKVKSDIRTIGNTNVEPPPAALPGGTPVPLWVPPPDEPFGKVTEVRIHQTALTAEEVEINSKVTLSGNEPGLAAYYRMDEAKGVDVRNAARLVEDTISNSSGYDAALAGKASWWPCAAPIGDPGYTVTGFDGVDDFISAPVSLPHGMKYSPGSISQPSPQTLPAAREVFSIEAWFRTDVIQKDPQVFQGILAWGNQSDVNGGIWLRLSSTGIELNGLSAQVDGLTGEWHHIAVIFDGVIRSVFLDGQRIKSDTPSLNIQPDTHVRIGWTRSRPDSTLIDDPFNGAITEVRVWKRQLIERELRENMRRRISGTTYDLVAYYPLKELDDQVPMNGAIIRADNALPLIGSEVITAEYSTLGTDATGKQTAMMRRFIAFPTHGGLQLLTGKRIETLERVWIGNTQFKPTLLGFIEGAPPVPSENLTERDDYNHATHVEMVVSQDMAYSWTREQDAGLGMNLSMYLGSDAEQFIVSAPLGVGTIETGASEHLGFKGDLTTGYSFLNSSTISAASSISSSDSIALSGTPESQVKFEILGRRFIPKNVGYALVVSGLADVYILRLKRSGKMIAYQVLPNPDIPLDVNTITFMINPAYVMNGSLDGLTGSKAANDRFFRNVPEMRARYGSNYPASYFRVKEAYDLKQQITNQDKQRESYFENFNSLLVDEGSLNRNISKPTEMPSASDLEARKQQIEQKIQDQELATHAKASFAAWQRKMEDLQVLAGKHNIVNTYVWDSDGGLRAESQSFANTLEHTVGGSFSLEGAFGFEGNFDILGLALGLTAQATVHVTQTMTKTESNSRGFAVNVDLSGLESTGITDSNDYPILPGEKVNRYRMMSFFLEGSTDHYNTFFREVVDPEWLQSNSEEARSLRQVQAGKPNKTWRVLHRVTYVERPALMGFGRDVRKLIQSQDQTASLDSILLGVSQIQADSKKLQAQFNSLAGELGTLGGAGTDLKQQLDDMQKALTNIQQALNNTTKQPVGKKGKMV